MASFITKNFLDNEGLKAFWRLIKQYIEDYVANKLEVGGEIKWDNILNKPTISTVSNASSHTHTAEFSDTEGHTHTFSGTSGTTNYVEDHVHSVNFTSELSEGHTHTFTPSGNVTLKVVSLDDGVLTLGAEFVGNSLTTTLTDKHTHAIVGTSNSAGGHEHSFTPAGSVNNGKATGTVTVNNETAHTHVVEIDLKNTGDINGNSGSN